MDVRNRVYCAAVTPMGKNGDIDFGGFEANLEWYINKGIGGILVCGGTGEFVSLSTEERLKLAERAGRQIRGQTGFMVGCGAETTNHAILYAKHAQEMGADSILIIASYYFKPSEEELYQHFKAVAESVSIPVVLYNNPGACGTDLTPAFVKRLSEIPNIRFIKEASGDLVRIREIKEFCSPDFGVMCGCDYLAYETFKNGATGWISITANALTSESQEILDCMLRGEEKRAWSLFSRYLPAYTICEKPYKAVQIIKYMMDRIGCCGGFSRLPRLELSDPEKKFVDDIMKKTGMLEK